MSKHIVAAWAEAASGSGWSNTPIWYLTMDSVDLRYEVECLQPEEQTEAMRALHATCSAAHLALTHEVRRVVKK